MKPSPFRFLKAWHALRTTNSRLKKQAEHLAPHSQTSLREGMQVLLQQMQLKAHVSLHAKALLKRTYELIPKTRGDYLKEFVGAIIFALVVATLIRTMWFELYEIPTGSMRPTFQEQDHLIASKTSFGINIPLSTGHFYWDQERIDRNQIVIFTVGDLPVPDPDTTYFWLFKGKRLLVKRLIAKPLDQLYFYGGKIYGRGADEKPFTIDFANIAHVPVLSFEGTISHEGTSLLLSQTQEKLAKFTKQRDGLLLVNGKWIPDEPSKARQPHNAVTTYSDFWGFKNFALVKLLTKEQVKEAKLTKEPLRTEFYLQLQHHFNLTYPKPVTFASSGQEQLLLVPHTTLLPLDDDHLQRLMDHLYTGRFVVRDQHAYRYIAGAEARDSIILSKVPDGTYEFHDGKAYEVKWAGVQEELPKEHPLYQRTTGFCQGLFNLGFEFNPAYDSGPDQPWNFSQRFAYYNQGDLYVMNAPLFTHEEATLQAFVKAEEERQNDSSAKRPYLAFVDTPPPMAADGGIDPDFLKNFGMHVPAGKYFVLGDNYAMSSDSRAFGCVPEQYLKGTPLWVFWPVGAHWGAPLQPYLGWISLPNAIIVIILGGLTAVWAIVHRRRCQTLLKELKEHH